VSVLRVLHGAGNIRDLLPLATHPAVDAIEADIWVRGDQLVAHHDRPLGPLPLTIGGTGIHREDTDPVMLREILEAVGSHTRVVLDLRSWLADPAPDLARELLRIEDRSHLTVSCEAWQIADRLRAWMPDLRVAYSIRSEPQLRRYVHSSIAYRGSARPIAIRHDLLHTPEEVDALRRHAGTIAAWTVDDVDRALELAAWRVDAIVSNHLTVLNAL
jgi:glycerophosphoryl diester phosphodiesterase